MTDKPKLTVIEGDGKNTLKEFRDNLDNLKKELENHVVNTDDAHCALICMIVSNPGGKERPHAWQKTVNDLIRALQKERNDKNVALKLAVEHIHHMAHYITTTSNNHLKNVYSFEALGEDMPAIEAALKP